MGARREQIRNIFVFQGVLIGVGGHRHGLIAGHAICYLADRYRWVQLDEQVYSLSFVPFEPRLFDSIWIARAPSGELHCHHLSARRATRMPRLKCCATSEQARHKTCPYSPCTVTSTSRWRGHRRSRRVRFVASARRGRPSTTLKPFEVPINALRK